MVNVSGVVATGEDLTSTVWDAAEPPLHRRDGHGNTHVIHKKTYHKERRCSQQDATPSTTSTTSTANAAAPRHNQQGS